MFRTSFRLLPLAFCLRRASRAVGRPPRRGPLGDSSTVKSTRWPSRSSSKTAPRTDDRWKKCSTPLSSRMNPKPLSMSSRAIVPLGMTESPLIPNRGRTSPEWLCVNPGQSRRGGFPKSGTAGVKDEGPGVRPRGLPWVYHPAFHEVPDANIVEAPWLSVATLLFVLTCPVEGCAGCSSKELMRLRSDVVCRFDKTGWCRCRKITLRSDSLAFNSEGTLAWTKPP